MSVFGDKFAGQQMCRIRECIERLDRAMDAIDDCEIDYLNAYPHKRGCERARDEVGYLREAFVIRLAEMERDVRRVAQ
jgi:hypothetical protein